MKNNYIFIAAEIGINHNGDINIAKKLIDMAKQTGCDAVKFQKRTLNIVYDEETLNKYRESPWGTTNREQKEGIEFGKAEYDEIDRYCKEVGIDWFASAWDIPSQEFLRPYNLKYNKIASAMLLHWDFLDYVAKERKLTFVSTGMSKLEDIDKAVDILKKNDCPFVLMHTISTYPSKDEDSNLRMINTLEERYNCKVGYSGHEVGVLPSVLAVAAGAEYIERHITLDRAMYGSDQSASLEKRGLEILVRDCRAVNSIFGDGIKKIIDSEREISDKLRYFMGSM